MVLSLGLLSCFEIQLILIIFHWQISIKHSCVPGFVVGRVGKMVRICPAFLEFTIADAVRKVKAILSSTQGRNQEFWIKIAITFWVFTVCQAPCRMLLVLFLSVRNLFWNFALIFAGKMHVHTNKYLWKLRNISVEQKISLYSVSGSAIMGLVGFCGLVLLGILPPFITFLWEKLCCVLSSYLSPRLLESNWCVIWGLVYNFWIILNI